MCETRVYCDIQKMVEITRNELLAQEMYVLTMFQ